MNNFNPIQMMGLIKQGGPKAAAIQIINQQYPNDPQMQQLLKYGNEGNTQAIQQFAQQYLGQQGIDINTELAKLRGMFGR